MSAIAWDSDRDEITSTWPADRQPADRVVVRRHDEHGSTDEESTLSLLVGGRSLLVGWLVFADECVFAELRRKLRFASARTSGGYVEAGGMTFDWWRED